MDPIETTYQAMQRLLQGVKAGQLFATLPNEIAKVMATTTHQDQAALTLPPADDASVQYLAQLAKQQKDAAAAPLSDADLEFLVSQLQNPHPQLRDKGAWFTFGDLLQNHALTKSQVVWLFNRLQAPELLFAGILAPHNDAVFGRSFAVMVLSAVVYADRTYYHALDQEDYQGLVLPLAVYIALEADGRGFVDQKGWAHSYMHIANLLDELTEVPTLTRAEKVFLMFTALNGWQRQQDALVYGEDQRFALYLTNLASKHQFYAQSLVLALTAWQKRLRHLHPGESIAFWNRWYNRSRLLEACIMRADMPQVVVDYLQKIIDMY